jgi:hypothetical protein
MINVKIYIIFYNINNINNINKLFYSKLLNLVFKQQQQPWRQQKRLEQQQP